MAVERDPVPLIPVERYYPKHEALTDDEEQHESAVLVFERLLHESAQREQQRAKDAVVQTLETGEWCAYCKNKLGTVKSEDGVVACAECAEAVLEALAKYSDDEADLEAYLARYIQGPFFSNRANRRAATRQGRRRNNGLAYGVHRTGSLSRG